MTLDDILRKGYFPKELPPPFSTEAFADFFRSKNNFKSYQGNKKQSKYALFSIPKIAYSRTKVALVNPYNFLNLCEVIVTNWTNIESLYNRSTITTSLPKLNGNRFKTEYTFHEFREKALIESVNTNTLLVSDISRFYSSVYTHSIPWAIHTKSVAKLDRTNTLYGNAIDEAVRNCQDQQTNGIPVGPITSLIIAEILLCDIDRELGTKVNLRGKRYIDDYLLFFQHDANAENCLKLLQHYLLEFQLEINNHKTQIERLPYILDDVWLTELSSFIASYNHLDQKSFFTKLYSKAMELVKKFPDKFVVKYLIQIIKEYYIKEESWELFQTYLLNLTKIEPSVLPDTITIILSYHGVYNFSTTTIKEFFSSLIDEHISKGNHYEVSWSLWLFVELQLILDLTVAEKILNSTDTCSKIILFHLEYMGLISGSLLSQKARAQAAISTDDLYNENWLYIYESFHKSWMTLNSGTHPVQNDKFFKLLHTNGISFYNSINRVIPLDISALSESDLTKLYIESDSIKESISMMKSNIEEAESFEDVKEAFNDFLNHFESFVEELESDFSDHIEKLIKKKREY